MAEQVTTNGNKQEQQGGNLKVGMVPELYRAALNGSFEEVVGIPTWLEQVTPTENNVLHLHLGRPLHKTAKGRTIKGMVNVQFIKKVLEFDVKLLYKANNKGDTPLHLGARFGHELAVKELLVQARVQGNEEETRRLLRMINKKKDTALHDAARMGYAEVVEELVKCDPHWRHEPNEVRETPLYLAAERGSTDSLLKIIETCHADALDYKFKGPCGRTVLHAVALWGKFKSGMAKKILEKDSSLIRVQDDEGMTPLHCAAMYNRSRTLEQLLLLDYDDHNTRNESSAVYIQDTNGRTALHISVRGCNWDAMNIIIASCPDCIEITDDKGQNVMHYVAKQACYDKIENFLKLENFDSLINEKDVDGNTPLHIFAACLLTDFDPFHSKNCLYSLSYVIRRSSIMDKKAFNRDNLNFADILASHIQTTPYAVRSMLWKGLVPRGKRVHKFKDDVNIEEVDDLEKMGQENVEKAVGNQMVVAALISTVSFTSALTLPGGFNQNAGKDIGMAVLTSKGVFKAFVISDVLAFAFSTIAIMFYFVLTTVIVRAPSGVSIKRLAMGSIFTTLALGSMGVALTTGLCAVISHSRALVFVVLFISAIFFFYCIIMVIDRFQVVNQSIRSCHWKSRLILPKPLQKTGRLATEFATEFGLNSVANSGLRPKLRPT